MEINYPLIILAAVVQFVLGALWYSPVLFGNTWMKVMGAEKFTKEEIVKMQKEMGPFYALQFVLGLITIFVLASNLAYNNLSGAGAYAYAFFMWFGYIMPIQVGSVIWGSTAKKFWLRQILIMISYQLVAFMLITFILTF
jgi:hypothetical protein